MSEAIMGRPTLYTQDLSDTVCERLAAGESMKSISRDDSMPCAKTMFSWLRTNQEFLHQYEKAKQESHLALAEEIMEIADDSTNDYMERKAKNGEMETAANPENIQRSRLRVDSRKWILSKLVPKKYGDRVHTEHSGSLNHTELSPEELNRKIAAAEEKLSRSEED